MKPEFAKPNEMLDSIPVPHCWILAMSSQNACGEGDVGPGMGREVGE